MGNTDESDEAGALLRAHGAKLSEWIQHLYITRMLSVVPYVRQYYDITQYQLGNYVNGLFGCITSGQIPQHYEGYETAKYVEHIVGEITEQIVKMVTQIGVHLRLKNCKNIDEEEEDIANTFLKLVGNVIASMIIEGETMSESNGLKDTIKSLLTFGCAPVECSVSSDGRPIVRYLDLGSVFLEINTKTREHVRYYCKEIYNIRDMEEEFEIPSSLKEKTWRDILRNDAKMETVIVLKIATKMEDCWEQMAVIYTGDLSEYSKGVNLYKHTGVGEYKPEPLHNQNDKNNEKNNYLRGNLLKFKGKSKGRLQSPTYQIITVNDKGSFLYGVPKMTELYQDLVSLNTVEINLNTKSLSRVISKDIAFVSSMADQTETRGKLEKISAEESYRVYVPPEHMSQPVQQDLQLVPPREMMVMALEEYKQRIKVGLSSNANSYISEPINRMTSSEQQSRDQYNAMGVGMLGQEIVQKVKEMLVSSLLGHVAKECLDTYDEENALIIKKVLFADDELNRKRVNVVIKDSVYNPDVDSLVNKATLVMQMAGGLQNITGEPITKAIKPYNILSEFAQVNNMEEYILSENEYTELVEAEEDRMALMQQQIMEQKQMQEQQKQGGGDDSQGAESLQDDGGMW